MHDPLCVYFAHTLFCYSYRHSSDPSGFSSVSGAGSSRRVPRRHAHDHHGKRKLYRSNMKKAKLDLSEFMVMCREQGYFSLSDIHTAVFEYNGKLTILPVSPNAPSHRRT